MWLTYRFLQLMFNWACRKIYQEYCSEMSRLSLGIVEILGMSLGVKNDYLKELYRENESIMRLNYYPPCQRAEQVLGTGPHYDPTSVTILHQDTVGGLQVFVDNQWSSITPNRNAFVVNIGDTFMVIKWFSSLFFITVFKITPQNSNHYSFFHRRYRTGGTRAVCIEQWWIAGVLGNHLLSFCVQTRIRWWPHHLNWWTPTTQKHILISGGLSFMSLLRSITELMSTLSLISAIGFNNTNISFIEFELIDLIKKQTQFFF